MRLALASLVCLAFAPACTTPYRIDASVRDDGGRSDGGVDAFVPVDGGPDSPDSPDAFTCVPSCIDPMQLSPCAGADPIGCDLGCIDGPPAHCGVMVIANVDAALAGTPLNGDVVIAADGLIDTGACAWPHPGTPIVGQVVSVAGGPEVCLFRFTTLTVPVGAEVGAVGPRPLVIVAEGEVQILGELSVDSRRAGTSSPEVLGAGANTGGTTGTPGTAGGMYAGGGGGGGFATDGGDGGNAISGAGIGGMGGVGASYPLEPLVGGARGGGGGGGVLVTSVGGAGGGAMQISSRTRIVSLNYLGASGAGGERGGGVSTGGAGGGSGGAIFLEAPEIMLGGDLNVAGGGGGSGSCLSGSGSGGNDGAGQTSTPSGGGACALGGSAGGRGAGGASPAGSDAGDGSGGGGGAGVVRFRVLSPLILPGSVRLNPRLAPGLYTVDPLAIR